MSAVPYHVMPSWLHHVVFSFLGLFLGFCCLMLTRFTAGMNAQRLCLLSGCKEFCAGEGSKILAPLSHLSLQEQQRSVGIYSSRPCIMMYLG